MSKFYRLSNGNIAVADDLIIGDADDPRKYKDYYNVLDFRSLLDDAVKKDAELSYSVMFKKHTALDAAEFFASRIEMARTGKRHGIRDPFKEDNAEVFAEALHDAEVKINRKYLPIMYHKDGEISFTDDYKKAQGVISINMEKAEENDVEDIENLVRNDFSMFNRFIKGDYFNVTEYTPFGGTKWIENGIYKNTEEESVMEYCKENGYKAPEYLGEYRNIKECLRRSADRISNVAVDYVDYDILRDGSVRNKTDHELTIAYVSESTKAVGGFTVAPHEVRKAFYESDAEKGMSDYTLSSLDSTAYKNKREAVKDAIADAKDRFSENKYLKTKVSPKSVGRIVKDDRVYIEKDAKSPLREKIKTLSYTGR